MKVTRSRRGSFSDALLPNTDSINQAGLNDAGLNTTTFTVANGGRFRVGDLLQPAGSREVMLVTGVTGNSVTVTRGYGGSTKSALEHNMGLAILGNAALEGQDAPAARFTNRIRKSNFTQIFTASVEVSGTEAAVRQIAVDDEMNYQKTLRLRELLRDLENTVINGIAPTTDPQGSATVRRTMRGIMASIQTNAMTPGTGLIPSGTDLTEDHLNAALRTIWQTTSSRIDTIVVNGGLKRRINNFLMTMQRYPGDAERIKRLVSAYESDYGVCRIVLSRYVPADTVLFLDSSRISVLPLIGRSFAFKPLATTGDYESGEIVGEYTLEMRNEAAHGLLRGLAV